MQTYTMKPSGFLIYRKQLSFIVKQFNTISF